MRISARACRTATAVAVGLSVALTSLSAPAAAASDEDQVRSVLEGMNSSYNGSDFGGFAAHLCADMLQTAGFAAGWYQSRKTDGPTRIVVNSVKVLGNPPTRAVANVRFVAANQAANKTLDVDFVREGAEWKACQYDEGRTV